ncbi:MAG: hypothetical protein AAGG44_14010, partial [Planctomycetota bacterium]
MLLGNEPQIGRSLPSAEATTKFPRCNRSIAWTLRFAVLLVASFVSNVDPANGQDTGTESRESDTVWEISSRHLGDNGATELSGLHVRQVRDLSWTESSVDDFEQSFADTQADIPWHTVVYVHGNWTSAVDARKRGWMVYNSLSRRASHHIRFIVFSWDSERHSGFARDVRDKRAQLNLESLRLASVLR